MPVSPQIVQARVEDVDTLSELVRDYWRFEGIDGYDAAVCERTLTAFFSRASYGCGWIVWIGEKAAGYLIACYVFSLEHGGLPAEIDELFLRAPYRSAGLGRRLLETAEVEFRARGCTNVALQLGRENPDAKRFYRRCGYLPRDYELMHKML